jgi:short-subunit dehydrogenase
VVTVAGRRAEVLDGLAREVEGRAVVADLASEDEVRRLVDAAGDVDVVVSCAGVAGVGALGGFDVGGIDRVIDVNLRAPILLARLFGERMVERGAGHLVFVSALAGKAPAAGASLLSATQFGVRGFALALRQDWAPLGVGVSCVNVGPLGESEVADGVALPAGFRPKSVDDVAAAVIRVVRHDRAEVDVADPVKRAGVVFGQVAPQVAARLNRLSGAAGGW